MKTITILLFLIVTLTCQGQITIATDFSVASQKQFIAAYTDNNLHRTYPANTITAHSLVWSVKSGYQYQWAIFEGDGKISIGGEIFASVKAGVVIQSGIFSFIPMAGYSNKGFDYAGRFKVKDFYIQYEYMAYPALNPITFIGIGFGGYLFQK